MLVYDAPFVSVFVIKLQLNEFDNATSDAFFAPVVTVTVTDSPKVKSEVGLNVAVASPLLKEIEPRDYH